MSIPRNLSIIADTLNSNGTFSSITNSALTSGRVVYSTTGGLETDSANLAFDGGANLSTGGSNAATYNTLNVNNTSATGYSRMLFNIGSAGANGVGVIKYAPGIFFSIGTESDASSTPMTFILNNAEQMRLTSTGLGIGTSSPNVRTEVSGTEAAVSLRVNTANSGVSTSNYSQIQLSDNGAVRTFWRNVRDSTGQTQFAYNSFLSFLSDGGGTPTERARIDSSGNLLVGATSVTNTAKVGSYFNGSTTNGFVANDTAAAASTTYFICSSNGTLIGSIQRVGSTSAVVYNTTSDYRLKTVVGVVTGHGERIDALKPIDYQWKEGNAQARGFLAHEFQEVYANSVTGIKDAVDADGNPIHQAMQAGSTEVIADLVAEIQSLRKRLTALESKEIS